MVEYLPDEHDVAYYPEDNDLNPRVRDTIETLQSHRSRETQPLSRLSPDERLAQAINEANRKSTTDNYSIQGYGNCGCTELVHSLPHDTKALKDARKYLGSFTCGTKGHQANFPLSRVTLYSPSADELTSTLRALVLDESHRVVDVRNYDDVEKDEKRDFRISDDILGGIVSQDQTIASDKANDITLYEVASHVLPIYGHSDCSAVISRYDPCGCHLITTVAQEAPRSKRDDRPTRSWKKAVLSGIDSTCPMKDDQLGAGHEGILKQTWSVSSCQSAFRVIYRSLLFQVPDSDHGHIHLHGKHIDQEEYERLTRAQRWRTSDSSGLLQVPPRTHRSHSGSSGSSSSSSIGRKPECRTPSYEKNEPGTSHGPTRKGRRYSSMGDDPSRSHPH